jgi:alkanesulfonate monooxygenase SsuD/methylene tetrahydromethanopterin reductase-like flavin-dependent oxidoreductase (luciferase family)
VIAKKAATIDEISGGRLVLGLGAGWNRDEYEAFGFPYDRRVSRFEEAFTIIRTLLSEGRIDFEGEFYRLADCVLDPPPPRPGGPQLVVGSTGPRMLSITLPHVAAWNVWWDEFGNEPERFAPLVERVEEACQRVGRDPAEVEATACLLVQLGPRPTRRVSDNPVVGGPAGVADAVLRLHAAGAGHIQLVVDPIELDSIERLGETLNEIDAEGVRR